MNNNKITVIDSIMGSGKTSWLINNFFRKEVSRSILYVAPTLKEDDRILDNEDIKKVRKFYKPENFGSGKIGNIANLLDCGVDIASTHELFRRFDAKCRKALEENKYILVIDETITAVEPYHFTQKDDYISLLQHGDIRVNNDGLIEWIGSEYEDRYSDVRILAKNKCLFRVDEKFFLWHYPADIFSLFDEVYVCTYLFDGSLMKAYFDLYHIEYNVKSIRWENGRHELCDYYNPDKQRYRDRIVVYEGKLNKSIETKDNALSANWCKSKYHKSDLNRLKNSIYNFFHNIHQAKGNQILWTTFKDCKKVLSGKGYTNRFLACNARATNDYKDAKYLVYAVNYYVNPEIIKFFAQRDIVIDQDMIALSTLLQWIWRSNIRVSDSDEKIYIFIPSARMRRLFKEWIND